jgi:hypothetical protein
MYDISRGAGLGRDRGGGSGELLDHHEHEPGDAGYWQHYIYLGAWLAAAGDDGCGGVYDRRSKRDGGSDVSDDELKRAVRGQNWQLHFREETFMSSAINPEAAEPATIQSFNQSDRNPVVTVFGGTEVDGGQLPAPAMTEVRMTPESPAVSPDAGLQY